MMPPLHRSSGLAVCPTYFQTMPFPASASLTTWIAAGVFSVAVTLTGFYAWRTPALLGTFALLGACIGVVPVAMKLIYELIFSWAEGVPTFLRDRSSTEGNWERWFNEELGEFNRSRHPRNFGIAYSLLGTFLFWSSGAFDHLPALMLIVSGLIAVMAGFVCGVGLASIGCLAGFVWRFGSRFEICISEHDYGVQSTGKLLVHCYALVALVWCLYTSSATWSIPERLMLQLLLALPAFLFFVGTFVVSQFPLHRRMLRCKRDTLQELDKLFERLRTNDPSEMTAERRQQLDFCLTEIRRVRIWPEWPFSTRNLVGVVGTGLGAISPQVVTLIAPLVAKRVSEIMI